MVFSWILRTQLVEPTLGYSLGSTSTNFIDSSSNILDSKKQIKELKRVKKKHIKGVKSLKGRENKGDDGREGGRRGRKWCF